MENLSRNKLQGLFLGDAKWDFNKSWNFKCTAILLPLAMRKLLSLSSLSMTHWSINNANPIQSRTKNSSVSFFLRSISVQKKKEISYINYLCRCLIKNPQTWQPVLGFRCRFFTLMTPSHTWSHPSKIST